MPDYHLIGMSPWSVQSAFFSSDNCAASDVLSSYAFVTSRVNCCRSLLIGVPKKTTDKLQRVFNAVAKVVSNTRKYDQRLSRFWQGKLLWWTWTIE